MLWLRIAIATVATPLLALVLSVTPIGKLGQIVVCPPQSLCPVHTADHQVMRYCMPGMPCLVMSGRGEHMPAMPLVYGVDAAPVRATIGNLTVGAADCDFTGHTGGDVISFRRGTDAVVMQSDEAPTQDGATVTIVNASITATPYTYPRAVAIYEASTHGRRPTPEQLGLADAFETCTWPEDARIACDRRGVDIHVQRILTPSGRNLYDISATPRQELAGCVVRTKLKNGWELSFDKLVYTEPAKL